MPDPADQTPAERRAEGECFAAELEAADREDRYLFAQQALVFSVSESQLRAALPEDEVERILAYRRRRPTPPE